MPGRITPLVNEEIYHVVNRGIASQPTFIDVRNYQRAIETMFFYQNLFHPCKYSLFLVQARKKREEILENLRNKKGFLVEIISFCFMPNHFHFLLKQKVNHGISKFMSDFTNSYTRYFNTRAKRDGPIFKGGFKAVRIETDEQLMHVSRYIHLNPYSSFIVKTIKALMDYPYSSFQEYLGQAEKEFCQKEVVLTLFSGIEDYKKFVFDRADYQKNLEIIKHLCLEK